MLTVPRSQGGRAGSPPFFSGKKNSCEIGFQGPRKKDGIRELSIDVALLKGWEPRDGTLLPRPLKPMTRHTHSW